MSKNNRKGTGIYMCGYMLITVCEREIMTEQFPSLECAQKCMHKEMTEFGDVPEDIFDNEEYDDGKYSAYVNDGVNHSNYDWSIVSIGEINEDS